MAISPHRANAFFLSEMARPRMSLAITPHSHETVNLLLSVEAREGVSTGISAEDRAITIGILGEETPNPRRLVKPGHIFPVLTKEGGVLMRNALPEGALDVVRIAGSSDAALYLDLLDKSGNFLSKEAEHVLCTEQHIPFLKLSDLILYRLETEKVVHRIAETKLPTMLAGDLRSFVYKSSVHGGEHLALLKGEINPNRPMLTRVQPEFTFGDVFGGENPPTRSQIQRSLKAIGENGSGLFVYLRRSTEGELKEQISSWSQKFAEKPAAMLREYGIGAQIIRDLGIEKIEVLTTSQRKLVGLTSFGIEIVAQRNLDEFAI